MGSKADWELAFKAVMDGIHHIAVRVNDCEVSASFYERAFGLRAIRRIDEAGEVRAIWLRRGGLVLMLERRLRGSGARQGSGHVLVFPTEDLTAAESRLRESDIMITDRTDSTLYVEDPDGHRAGISAYAFDKTAP